jgi:3D (Asp-Asp-Asp) domain-containing protein
MPAIDLLHPVLSPEFDRLPNAAREIGAGIVHAPAVPLPGLGVGGRARRLPHVRRGVYAIALLALVGAATGSVAVLRWRAALAMPSGPIVFAPAVIYAPIQLDGALVRGASPDWAVRRDAPLRYGDPVPVTLTAYCLRGLTRRDHYVRQGIVASDPKVFPLGRYVEIYVGRAYYGRFLIDDTGRAIKGGKLDIWTPTCREARIFGRTLGTAVLVPRPTDARRDTLLTGRLGGAVVPDSTAR